MWMWMCMCMWMTVIQHESRSLLFSRSPRKFPQPDERVSLDRCILTTWMEGVADADGEEPVSIQGIRAY